MMGISNNPKALKSDKFVVLPNHFSLDVKKSIVVEEHLLTKYAAVITVSLQKLLGNLECNSTHLDLFKRVIFVLYAISFFLGYLPNWPFVSKFQLRHCPSLVFSLSFLLNFFVLYSIF